VIGGSINRFGSLPVPHLNANGRGDVGVHDVPHRGAGRRPGRYVEGEMRVMKRLILMTCTMLAAALPALAQTPTVDELLARNLASRGGAEKLKAISTRKVTGKVTVQVQMPPAAQQQQAPPAPQAVEMPMSVLAKRPNLMLQEMRMQDRRVVTAFDGQQAWAINPMIGNSAQLLQGVQADLIRDQAQFDGPLAYARQRGDKMEVLGKEDVEGVSSWKLAITHEDKTTTVYLDEKTGLERKVSASVNQGGTQLLVESLISDYQPVDGIMVPRKVQTLVGGKTQATVTIDSVEFNVPIDDAQFKMPAAQ
jgi:outer membrane lipoprotein-sorting protein